jgi:hypothetical protein
LELGKQLVAQLDAKDDMLGSWMAHYVAERLEAAEKAPSEARDAAEDACARAILDLWRYRRSLPDHLRPLVELEPILRVIASLDVDRTIFHYHPAALRQAALADADDEVKQWLELALGLDYSARLLIQFVLRSAAHRGASQAAPWVELARCAGADEGPEVAIVEFVRGADEAQGQDAKRHNAAILDRVSRLEDFAKLAMSLAEGLRAEIGIEAPEEE